MNIKLNEPQFRFMPINDIKPAGWLIRQLKIQADGLSGSLDKFWPDIKDSKWIGGAAEGWERMPYWLDGFIPLAFLIGDEDMKNRACGYIGAIIEKQEPDGWLCPVEKDKRASYDVWAVFLILKVLTVYHDATGDEKIEAVVYKALAALDRHIDSHTLFGWGMMRWFEALIPIYWLYERRPEEWLANLVSKLGCQGFDWKSFFGRWVYQTPDERGRWSMMSHAVNNAMAVKAGPMLWRLTGADGDLALAGRMKEMLGEYHGMVTGMFTGDECLSGKSPVQGTELCAVAEYMYSVEHVLSITGQSMWGDLLEQIAFNALPATLSPDMWSHQYDQQVNQPQCSTQENPIYRTNSGESNIFGLEPNYGCCTANFSQAWPKFAASVFMRSRKGIAAVAYAPCEAAFLIDGKKVAVSLETDYPFDDVLLFKVTCEKPVRFSFDLRIPDWAAGPALEIGGDTTIIQNSGFYAINRVWEEETAFILTLPMQVRLETRPNGLFAVMRGPLVYSLPVGEEWVRINKDMPGREHPHCDYEIFPATAWNYGLSIDKHTPEKDIGFIKKTVGNYPFSPDGAPVEMLVKGRKIDWGSKDGVPSAEPEMAWVSDDAESLRLIPYGCTNLRMTELPIVK